MTSDPHAIHVYDRRRQILVRETVLGDLMLRLAYRSPLRRPGQWVLFRSVLLTRLLGRFCDSRISRWRIKPTIRRLDIDMSEFAEPAEAYRTFNEFFYRKIKPGARPFSPDPGVLVSPADARLTVWPKLDGNTCIPVKGARFTVAELLRVSREEAARFDGGVLMIFRLCPADYHRYHFPAAGTVSKHWRIDGRFDSVNPISLALGIRVFQENTREVSLLDLGPFGAAAFVEVGAFGVAGIESTHRGGAFAKMDEKGYFKFGGSTVVLVLKAGRIEIDADLVERSAQGTETLIRAGESIGRLLRK
jgi:phosphatidylserine decarboxylase